MPEFIVKNPRPSASQVRAWGRDHNFPGRTESMVSANTRGKLNPALIGAFNKVHKGQNAYVPGKGGGFKVVTHKPVKGRTVTVKVDVPAARQAAAASGIPVGSRGRLSKATMTALLG